MPGSGLAGTHHSSDCSLRTLHAVLRGAAPGYTSRGEGSLCPHLLQHSLFRVYGGRPFWSGVRWCLSCLRSRELQKRGHQCPVSSLPCWRRQPGVTPDGVAARSAQTRLAVHACGCVPCSVTTGVTAQPCCAQRLPGPQGSLSAVLAFTACWERPRRRVPVSGKHLDVTAGRVVNVGSGSGRCPSFLPLWSIAAGGSGPGGWGWASPSRLPPCRLSVLSVDEDGLTCPRSEQTLLFRPWRC